MAKLMKYEFRKTMFSKFILLMVTAMAEIILLFGIFMEWENGLAAGSIGLFFCAMFGIMYMGVESLITFHRDLSTKQSYMLFLTPKSSFQILGAKVVENALSIFLTGLFFALLAAIDLSVSLIRIGGLDELLELIKSIAREFSLNPDIPWQDLLLSFLALLASWLMMIAMGYLAIVLAATVFSGKRLSGVISLIIYLLLNWGVSYLLSCLPDMNTMLQNSLMRIGAAFVVVAIFYLFTGWIMERKLSV